LLSPSRIYLFHRNFAKHLNNGPLARFHDQQLKSIRQGAEPPSMNWSLAPVAETSTIKQSTGVGWQIARAFKSVGVR
jgi:hypothetical protein